MYFKDSNKVSFPPVKSKKNSQDDDDDGGLPEKEPFVAKNWTIFKRNERELRKMAPQQKSRYLAVSLYFSQLYSITLFGSADRE